MKNEEKRKRHISNKKINLTSTKIFRLDLLQISNEMEREREKWNDGERSRENVRLVSMKISWEIRCDRKLSCQFSRFHFPLNLAAKCLVLGNVICVSSDCVSHQPHDIATLGVHTNMVAVSGTSESKSKMKLDKMRQNWREATLKIPQATLWKTETHYYIYVNESTRARACFLVYLCMCSVHTLHFFGVVFLWAMMSFTFFLPRSVSKHHRHYKHWRL